MRLPCSTFRARARRSLALPLALLVAAAAGCRPEAEPAPEAAPPPQAAPPPAPDCDRITAVEIEKRARLLRARCQSGSERVMRVALGRAPVGPKREAGDLRTPEGLYHVVAPGRESRFHQFIPLDYPSAVDAVRGYAERRISVEELTAIARAHERGELPPQDTALGGEIGLHGEGDDWQGYSSRLDWTLGCIAVTDSEIEFLTARIEPGTPVHIRP